jgi:hypothetical protein
MENLLQQTLEILANNGKTPANVLWVGGGEYAGTWNDFAAVADVEYDDGFGSPKVATDLFVVGADWWLERHNYDGSEWWEFKTKPQRPANPKSFECVIGNLWPKMAQLHTEGDCHRLDVEKDDNS